MVHSDPANPAMMGINGLTALSDSGYADSSLLPSAYSLFLGHIRV